MDKETSPLFCSVVVPLSLRSSGSFGQCRSTAGMSLFCSVRRDVIPDDAFDFIEQSCQAANISLLVRGTFFAEKDSYVLNAQHPCLMLRSDIRQRSPETLTLWIEQNPRWAPGDDARAMEHETGMRNLGAY